MKSSKNFLIFAIFFVLMSASAFAAVSINPGNPGTNNDLTCYANQAGSYTYKWSLNYGPEQNLGTSVSNSLTTRGQIWTCRVYLIPNRYIPAGTKLGEATVTIANSNPSVSAIGPYSAVEGTVVNMAGAATDIDGDSISYSWNFGDGQTSNLQNTAHTYVQNGTYTVTLTATDSAGGSSTATTTATITDTNPVANAGPDQTVVEGTNVTLDGSLSTAYDLPISYSWVLANGTVIGNTVNPVYNFTQNGTYPVTLTVTDSDGSTANDNVVITVTDTVPTANAGVDQTVVEGNSVTFDGSLSTGYDQPLSYSWDLANGTNIGTGISPVYAFLQNGTYTVTLTVTDNDGSTATDNVDITVNDTAPVADFSFLPLTPMVGQQVNFTDLSTAYDMPLTYSWDFGDLGTDNIANTTHAYLANGTYTVTLTVTDNDGSVNSTARQITVSSVPVVIDTIAPATITGLVVTNVTNSTATWNWTNPLDLDFAGTILLLNGLNVANLTNTYAGYTAFNLVPNSTYTLSILTFDNATIANVNNTAVSANATTLANTIVIPVNDTIAPATISNLSATAQTNTSITWNWTNPLDIDFAGTNVYVDGTNVINLTAADAGYLGTFLPNTTHTITIYTKDLTGNINTTAVSNTSSTLANTVIIIPPTNDTIPPGTITNLTSPLQTNETITWQWTNPLDADFNGTIVLIDGVNVANYSAATVGNVFGSFLPNSTHTITVYTFDNATPANINWTGVSMNATTLANTILPLDTIAPGTVIGLGATVITNETITWNWTLPADPDLAGVSVMIDGFGAGAPANATGYTGTFLPNTTHEIRVLTYDNATPANVNVTSNNATTLANVAAIVHDVLISRTYINNVNGVRLSDSLGANVVGNLTQGQNYTIGYRVDNVGTVAEITDSFVRVYNSTGAIVFTNLHNNNIASGATSAHNIDVWNTAGFAAGLYTVQVNATIPVDSNISNNLGSRTVNLVLPPFINTAPAFTSLPVNTSIQNNTSFTYTVTANDINAGQTLTYSDNAAQFNINSNTGLISFTPTTVEVINAVITVCDNSGQANNCTTQPFTLNVTAAPFVNSQPTFTSTAINRNTHINTPFSYDVNATDSDILQTLNYSSNNAAVVIDPSTGLINFTPSTLGTIAATIKVCDNSGQSNNCTTQPFTLNVQNNAPVWTATPSQTVNEGILLTFTVDANDADVDVLTYTASGLPTGSNFNAATRTFTWTPTFLQSGPYSVRFNVTDSYGAPVQQTVLITVNNAVQNGNVTGFVLNNAGNPLAATVQLKNGNAVLATWLPASGNPFLFSTQPGTYSLLAFMTGYVDSTVSNVVITELGNTLRNITLTPLITQGNLSGTVRDSNNAIYGALVELRQSGVTIDSATTGADGKYSFANKVIGPYTLVVTKAGYDVNSQSVSVSAGNAVRDVTLAASATSGRISGTVLDGTNGMTAIVTTVTIKKTSGAIVQIVNTDASGHFTINGLPETAGFTYDLDAATVIPYTRVFAPTGLGLAQGEVKSGMDIYEI